MFDISRVGIHNLDQGAQMTIVDPVTGAPVMDEKGKPVTITLLGRLADKVQQVVRGQINRRLASASRNGSKPSTIEEAESNQLEQLVAATVAWSFDKMDGKPFPCTEDSARIFWANKAFEPIRRQALTFLEDDANFMKI
jgi:hypothetical protein